MEKYKVLKSYSLIEGLKKLGFKFKTVKDDKDVYEMILPEGWSTKKECGVLGKKLIDNNGLFRGYIFDDPIKRYDNGNPRPYNAYSNKEPILFKNRFDVREHKNENGEREIYFGGEYPNDVLYSAGKINPMLSQKETYVEDATYSMDAEMWGLAHYPRYESAWMYWDVKVDDNLRKQYTEEIDDFEKQKEMIELLGKRFISSKDKEAWEQLCRVQKDKSDLALVKKVAGTIRILSNSRYPDYDFALDYIFDNYAHSGYSLSWVFAQVSKYMPLEGEALEYRYYEQMEENEKYSR